MRTRTLLILAVVCGLAILLAGGIRLLSLSSDEAGAEDLAIGATGTAGDVTLTVLGATEADERLVVEVRIGGIDDPDGLASLTLLTGDQLPVLPPGDPRACAGVTVEPTTCVLVFDVEDVAGGARVLRLQRGEDEVRWSLANRVVAAPG